MCPEPPPPGKRVALRLLQGDLVEQTARVVVADDGSPPFAVDAMVIEQDCDLLLAPPAAIVQEPAEHPGRLLLRVLNQRRHPPGSVLAAGGRPLRLHAVVHDLERQPSWREEWVQAALTRLFDIARRRQVARLAMPLLGTVHGRLDSARSLALILAALSAGGSFPRRLWLRVPSADAQTVRSMLGPP